MRETERQRARHRGAEFRRRIGKRIVFERPDDDPADAGGRAIHASLAEQDDVAAR